MQSDLHQSVLLMVERRLRFLVGQPDIEGEATEGFADQALWGTIAVGGADADSLALLELTMSIEDELGVAVADLSDTAEDITIVELVDLLAASVDESDLRSWILRTPTPDPWA